MPVAQQRPLDGTLIYSESDRAIADKFDALGGAAKLGAFEHKDFGKAWYLKNGSCICYNREVKQAFELHGAIYRKWQELGGLHFATPCTDETVAPDGIGLFNHFNHGKSIYWSPITGAHAIYGAIREKWQALGWERSYLGYPLTDEVDFEGGRANGFQNGDIYWWEDLGAIDLRGVVIHYTGMYCFEETDGPGDDETYAVISVSNERQSSTLRTKIYGGMHQGQSRPEVPPMEIYRGKPYGLTIDTRLVEHDAGDPDSYRDDVKKIVMAAHEVGKVALGFIPIVGPAIAGIIGPKLDVLMPDVGDAIANIFGDVPIGANIHRVRGRDLVEWAARRQNRDQTGIGFKFDTGQINGRGASYTVYYGIVPA